MCKTHRLMKSSFLRIETIFFLTSIFGILLNTDYNFFHVFQKRETLWLCSIKHKLLNTFLENITKGTLYLVTLDSIFPILVTKCTASFAISQTQ